jgi:hypothetical protein
MPFRKGSRVLPSLAGAIFAWCFVAPMQVAQAVTFYPGTYHLADTFLGAPVDTLAVSVSGGVASFVLSGADSETFSVPSPSTPTGRVLHNDPYYLVAPPVTASWNTTLYPYLTFYRTSDHGGLSITNEPGDPKGSSILLNLFQSTEGTGQAFSATATPLPASWTLMLAGLAGFGLLLHRRHRKTNSVALAAALS